MNQIDYGTDYRSYTMSGYGTLLKKRWSDERRTLEGKPQREVHPLGEEAPQPEEQQEVVDDSASIESDSSSYDSEDDETLREMARRLKRLRSGPDKNGEYNPQVGDIVEVLWIGEGRWFEGEVLDVEDDQFKVFYKYDGEKHWHDSSTNVRLKL